MQKKKKGFSVRLDDKAYVAGIKELKGRRFVCSKEGYCLQNILEIPPTKRASEPRALTRCC
jgi:hypothetical protein